MVFKFGSLSSFALAVLLASVSQGGVIVNPNTGWTSGDPDVGWPASFAVSTTAAPDEMLDQRGMGAGRNIFQTFQVDTAFKLDKIYIPYSANNVITPSSSFALRIFTVNNVNEAPANYTSSGPTFSGTGLILSAVATLPATGFAPSTQGIGVFEFDLTGIDEITLPATTGTAGYALQLYTQGVSVHPFTLRYSNGAQNSLYSGGRYYEWGDSQWKGSNNPAGDRDFAFRMTAVPEPNQMILIGMGFIGLAGICKRFRK